MTFSGFDHDALTFLADLAANNTKEYFAANRDRYEALLASGKEFVEEAGTALSKISPDVHAEPRVNGSIFRINRDARFLHGQGPYKETFDLWFWAGERKVALTGFFARVSPDEFGLGVGAHRFDSLALHRFRTAVASEAGGSELDSIATKLERSGTTIEGAHYSRYPKGFDHTGPGAGFLLHNSLHAYVAADPEIVTDGKAVMAHTRKIWRSLAPIHRWLIDHVAAPEQR
jgi:uncharacterized protein (TIGR02453 family)